MSKHKRLRRKVELLEHQLDQLLSLVDSMAKHVNAAMASMPLAIGSAVGSQIVHHLAGCNAASERDETARTGLHTNH